MTTRILRVAGALPAISLAAALIHLGPGQAHEAHLHFSAGQPGNPNKPARTVTVLMREMQFEPSRIEVRKGEQIRFVLRNVGTESHEFVLNLPVSFPITVSTECLGPLS